MPNETFTFFCPSCGAKLTLPLHLAGVVGPCPSCRTQIQAPTAEAFYRHSQQTLQFQPAPYPQPLPSPADTNRPQPASPQPQQPQPEAAQPPAPAAGEGADTAARPGFRMEPRQLPARSAEVVSRPISDDVDRPRAGAQIPPARRRHSGAFRRALVPLVFISAAVMLVAGLVTLLKQQPGGAKAGTRQPGTQPSAVKEIFPKESAPVPDGAQNPQPNTPAVIAPLVTAAEKGNRALATLETFLAATTLAERQPLIESKTPPKELETSCLAGKLPAASIITKLQETNDIEKVVDCFYTVTFTMDDGKSYPQTMLVRIRGDGSPKVVVDPFLDLYGGRLKAFAADPTKNSGTFQVVLSALPFVDKTAPRQDTMFTLRLQADDSSSTEIATAIGEKHGPIGTLLDDHTSGLRWGQAKACTVLLEWNRSDPAKPYLEALNIEPMDWNP